MSVAVASDRQLRQGKGRVLFRTYRVISGRHGSAAVFLRCFAAPRLDNGGARRSARVPRVGGPIIYPFLDTVRVRASITSNQPIPYRSHH